MFGVSVRPWSLFDNFADLDRWLNVGEVRDVAKNFFGVRAEGGLEIAN